jgi:site-specific recombinase XerC
VSKVQQPVEALTARELGRLMRAIKNHRWGPDWLWRRNVAIVALMSRAGLCIGEVLALDHDDVTLTNTSGWIMVRQGKGLKERRVPLSSRARTAIEDYLEVRPEQADISALFITKNWNRLSKRPVQRMVRAPLVGPGSSERRPVTCFATPLPRAFWRRAGI